MSVTEMVKEFHEATGHPIGTVEFEDEPEVNLRLDLVYEEVRELEEAVSNGDAEATLDALADLAYVTVGFAVGFGWDFDEAFERVHASNMTKADGNIKFFDNGKIMKNENYQPPDLSDLV